MHHIRSKLFPLPLAKLHFIYNLCLENHITNPNSNGYKLVLYIARNRLFKPAVIKKEEIYKLFFFNFRLPTHVLIPLAYSISFITNQSNLQFRYILKISPYLYYRVIIPHQLQPYYSTTRTGSRISILTTSSVCLLIAPCKFPHSYILWLSTL